MNIGWGSVGKGTRLRDSTWCVRVAAGRNPSAWTERARPIPKLVPPFMSDLKLYCHALRDIEV